MSHTVVVEGKSVDEAISKALTILKTEKDQVNIKVMREGTNGILGIGAKQAVVEVCLLEELVKGKAWIENGEIQYRIDEENTQSPTIVPSENIEIYKNGELMEQEFSVDDSDILLVETHLSFVESKCSIELLNDEMEALLRVVPGQKTEARLVDKSPASRLVITTEEKVIENNDIQKEMIEESLKELNVTVGIDEEKIEQACHVVEESTFTVATGVAPIDGRNGWIEHSTQIDEGMFFTRPDGSIDFRKVNGFPTVNIGDQIAIIHDPVPGKGGLTVTGKEIQVNEVHPLKVYANKGAILLDNKIMATESGRPKVAMRGQEAFVSIEPILIHPKDVSISTGNLFFTGDIEVKGKVEEAMSIEAKGSVLIHNEVSEAIVLAGESIMIKKNVLGSRVQAGFQSTLIKELNSLLVELIKQQEQVKQAIEQIVNNVSNQENQIPLKNILTIVLEKKYSSIPNLIEDFHEKIKENESFLDEKWYELYNEMEKVFIQFDPSKLRSLDDLNSFIEMCKSHHQMYELKEEQVASLTLAYAQNSKLQSSGDILIIGQGSYNSIMKSGNKINVNGVIRGGELYAEKGMELNEVGSHGGAKTKLIVSEEGYIFVKKIYPDTTIQIGNRKFTYQKETHQVHARLVDGQISFRSE